MFILLWAYYYVTYRVEKYFFKKKSDDEIKDTVKSKVSVSFDGSIVLNKDIEETVTSLDVYVYKNPMAMYEVKKIITSTNGVRIYILQNSLNQSTICMPENSFNKMFKVKEIEFNVGNILEKIRGGHD